MPANNSAAQFIKKLKTHRSVEELKKIQRYFKSGERESAEGDEFIGVRMGQVFALAKEFIEMPLSEIEKLLDVARGGRFGSQEAFAISGQALGHHAADSITLFD